MIKASLLRGFFTSNIWFDISVGAWVSDSQNITIKNPEDMISFNIKDDEQKITYSRTCIKGMTFREFIKSDYNLAPKLSLDYGDHVVLGSKNLRGDNSADQTIIENKVYEFDDRTY